MKKELENLLDDFALANIEEYPFEFEMTKGYYSAEILSLFEKTMQNAEDEIADYIDDAESEGDIQIYIKGNEISKDIINIIKDKIKDKNDYKLTAES